MFFSKRRQLPYQKTYSFLGRMMSYRELGHGKPVVLLHGAMMSNPWAGFEKKLATRYRVYLPEMPGFGASDTIPGVKHNTDLFSDAFSVFIKKLELEKATVVALSLGTIVAAKAAAKGNCRGKLILTGAPVKVTAGWTRWLIKIPGWLKRSLVGYDIVKTQVVGRALIANLGGANSRQINDFLNQIGTTDARAIADIDYIGEVEMDFPAVLRKVKNEKIFIFGENDKQAKNADRLTKKWITIPGAGHDIFRTNPKRALQCLTEVL